MKEQQQAAEMAYIVAHWSDISTSLRRKLIGACALAQLIAPGPRQWREWVAEDGENERGNAAGGAAPLVIGKRTHTADTPPP